VAGTEKAALTCEGEAGELCMDDPAAKRIVLARVGTGLALRTGTRLFIAGNVLSGVGD
jgi:hypothetical protein